MDYDDVLAKVIDLLQRDKRVPYRALKVRFQLDDDTLEALKDDLIYAKRLAEDENARLLVWIDDAATSQAPASTQPAQPAPVEPPLIESDLPEAERRQLTVMFCDLADSTPLSGQLDPEDLRDVIRAYQETAAAIMQRYAGHIAQYLGDGLLVYFGWPRSYEDNAARGVQAALDMIAALTTTLNPRLQQDKGVQLAVRIGIHTGLVVVGEMGGSGRYEQLALGETTNIAARIEGLAAHNTVLLSQATARLVADFFVCEDLGAQPLKGVAEPLHTFRAIRAYTATESEAAALAASAASLVGREAELALLIERWEQSLDGRGQVVLLSGEAGIGKSRLVEALRARINRDRQTSVTFRCSSYHQNDVFYPVLSHLERLLEFSDEETREVKFAKLAHALEGYHFPRADTLPLLATLLSLPLPGHVPPSQLTPEQQRLQLQADLSAWLLEEAERQPFLVVWEDLQWSDPSSLELLNLLIDQAPTVTMLIVGTYRPEFQAPWASRTHLTPIPQSQLGPAHVAMLSTQVAGGKPVPAALCAYIADKTDGIPLFVEEMTKTVLEAGILREMATHYELSGPLEALHDALMARLDRIQTAKNVAQLGAVIGRQFSYGLLVALTDYGEERLQGELELLVKAELLHQRGFPPHAAYRFKHALIQEVAYESLLRRQRLALHGAIAHALETQEGSQADEQAALLAYYAHSDYPDKAAAAALRAGDQALRLQARAEATTFYAQGLDLAQQLPKTPAAHRLQIDAIVKQASMSVTSDDFERDETNLEQAQILANVLADAPRQAQVLYWRGRIAYVRGDYPRAESYAEQSLAIADQQGDEALAAHPLNLLGLILFTQSDYVQASKLMKRNAEQMRQLGNTNEEATAAAYAGCSLGLEGAFEEALSYENYGLHLAQELHDPYAEAAAYQYRGITYEQHGDLPQAIRDFEAAGRLAAQMDDHFRAYIVKIYEGRAHTMAGDLAKGRLILNECMALAAQLGMIFLLGWGKAHLAECLVALGEYDAAQRLCAEAIELAEESGERISKALAHRALAETLSTTDPANPQQAEFHLLTAIELQQEMGNRPELGRSYACYARLLRQWGRQDAAEDYFKQAVDLFDELGMDWDRSQAEAHRRTTPSAG